MTATQYNADKMDNIVQKYGIWSHQKERWVHASMTDLTKRPTSALSFEGLNSAASFVETNPKIFRNLGMNPKDVVIQPLADRSVQTDRMFSFLKAKTKVEKRLYTRRESLREDLEELMTWESFKPKHIDEMLDIQEQLKSIDQRLGALQELSIPSTTSDSPTS